MKRALIVVVVLFIACKNDKPKPIPEAPNEVADKDIPTVADYQAEADRAITPENVEAEVAKMEHDEP